MAHHADEAPAAARTAPRPSRPLDPAEHVVRSPGSVRLEGLHALKHALRFGAEVLSARTSDRDRVLRLAEDACPDLLGRLASLLVEVDATDLVPAGRRGLPSPVVAEAVPADWSLADLAARPTRPVLLLERPTHLGNLGACIRVAAAADAAGVLVLGRQDPWHPMAVRGAAGLQYALPVVVVDRVPTIAGRPLVAVDPAGTPVPRGLPTGAIFAFGSERTGLSEALRARAGEVVSLPMRPGVSSLNLATSASALLYTLAPPR